MRSAIHDFFLWVVGWLVVESAQVGRTSRIPASPLSMQCCLFGEVISFLVPTNTYAPTPAPTALPTLRPSSRYTCSAKSCAALGWGNAASLYGDDDGEGDV